MPTVICPRERCTGCAACFNACPSECISMDPDQEGFLRPVIDQERCDECGACTDVCPILNMGRPDETRKPGVYACWDKDDAVRFRSASGGAFSAFASSTLGENGIVFGAAYDGNMKVGHVGVTQKGELPRLRGSKYVQSDVVRVYTEIRSFLKQGRKVLFSGTPCQVAGLKAFIGGPDDNMLTCDLLCKGVPSPGLFEKYVSNLEQRFRGKLVTLNPRHKLLGWKLPSTKAVFADGREFVLSGLDDAFMFGFANNTTLREACYQCPYSNNVREGDVSLGDFWGIGEGDPFHHDTRNGVSLVLVNTEKGHVFFGDSTGNLYVEQRTLAEARQRQRVMKQPVREPKERKAVFADYQRLGFDELAKRHLMDKGVKGLIKSVVPRIWLFRLKKRFQRPAQRQ